MNNIRKCRRSICGKELNSSRKVYCSLMCSSQHMKEEQIQKWLSGEWDGSRPNGELSSTIRLFLIEESGHQCSECGWSKINPTTGKVPLDIDHIDGDSHNNSPGNLKVLCPNCHSLTPTYKSLNKTGRAWRKKYEQYELKGRKEINMELYTCECGNTKDRIAKECSECYKRKVSILAKTNWPPIEEIIEGVKDKGFAGYARSINRSDNGIRKFLLNNGVDLSSLKAKKENIFCHCGKQVKKTVHGSYPKTCLEHRVEYFDYPPVDEIIKGVEKFGMTGYAKILGLSYASTLRKHLIRSGVNPLPKKIKI